MAMLPVPLDPSTEDTWGADLNTWLLVARNADGSIKDEVIDTRIDAAAGVTIASLIAGKIPTAQIPVVSLTTVQTADSEAAMLALTTQEGDVVVRTDEDMTYMRNAGTSGTMADFNLLNTPTDAVTSVNGQIGVVVLDKTDIGLGNVPNIDATMRSNHTGTQLVSTISDIQDFYYLATVVDGMIDTLNTRINQSKSGFGPVSGDYYNTFVAGWGLGRTGNIASAGLSAERIYFTPVYVPETTTFDRIGINVTVAVAASSARLGIFTMNDDFTLATLVLDAGTVDTSVADDVEATINQELVPGWYWLAVNPSAAISIDAASPATGFSYHLSAGPLAGRAQTSAGFTPFGATEAATTSVTVAYSTYLRAA